MSVIWLQLDTHIPHYHPSSSDVHHYETLLSPPVALRSTDAAVAVASFHFRAPWLQDGLSSAPAASLLPVATGDSIKSGGSRGFSPRHSLYRQRWQYSCLPVNKKVTSVICVPFQMRTAGNIIPVCRTQLGLNVFSVGEGGKVAPGVLNVLRGTPPGFS